MNEPERQEHQKEEVPFVVAWISAELIFWLLVIAVTVLVAVFSN